MKTRFSFFILGKLLKLLGLFMLAPAVCSFIYGEGDLWVFIVSGVVTSAFGWLLERWMDTGETVDELGRKDGFLIGSLAWVAAAIFGTMPYLLSGTFPHPVDALFESVSGFTTTGATVLVDIEALTRGMLFWRSFTQWLGGMGIIVLAIAILPRLRVGGMQLMALEGAGPTSEKIVPRISEVARNLWITYVAISAADVIALLLAGMPLYDALVHMFSTISTGGFSSRNLSIGSYGSVPIEVVTMVFMYIAAINFALLFGLWHGKFARLFTDPEYKFYTFLNIAIILVVALELTSRSGYQFDTALRYSSFQVLSLSTGTGFSTTNYDVWPYLAKWLLFILFFVGGCVGSTAGGLKQIRVLVLLKQCYYEIYRLIYPNEVVPNKVGKKILEEGAVAGVASFFIIYMLIFLVGSLLLMVEGVPTLTSISASAASISNVGPGFAQVGPAANYAFMSGFAKVNMSLLMLLGRLEIFTILVLFIPAFWRD